MRDLNSLQVLALANAVTAAQKKVARDRLNPGKRQVVEPFAVMVKGEIDVETDETYVPTTSISLIGAVLLATKRMGIQREPFLERLASILKEALEMDEQSRDALMAEAGVEEFEKLFREKVTSTLIPKSRKGKTKTRLEVESF